MPLTIISILEIALVLPHAAWGQVSCEAKFTLEKQTYLQGEPIFCTYEIRNTGAQTVSFSYRSPNRALDSSLEDEPRFVVTAKSGRPLPDPSPSPCGGAKGTVVYGYVRLPPGQVHTERWLLNQWARITPGEYRVKAVRRLTLRTGDPSAPDFPSSAPASYAVSEDRMSFQVVRSSPPQLRAIFAPYIERLDDPPPADIAEAVLVLSTLPQPFFLAKLKWLAYAPASERRWNRDQAVEGLARLGTRAAWLTIAGIARGEKLEWNSGPSVITPDDDLRAYAIQLIGEKGDSSLYPTLSSVVASSSPELRGDALRALGFLHDTRANSVLFHYLHAANTTDRVNAILGIKNLNSNEAVPALLAMLHDPDSEVCQVANFALQSLAGVKFKISPIAARADYDRLSEQWHQWWRAHADSFEPPHQAPCHDW